MKSFDARIKTPFRILVAGPSGAGKTKFVFDLINNQTRLLDTPLKFIYWFYGENKPEYHSNYPITFLEGLPEDFTEYIISNEYGLIVIDDLMTESKNDDNMTNLFSKRSRQNKVSVINITQNFYADGTNPKHSRKNASCYVIFKNPLDLSTPQFLARRLMPKNTSLFYNIYSKAVSKPHSYLYVDGDQWTPEYAKYRSDIMGDVQNVFIPDSTPYN